MKRRYFPGVSSIGKHIIHIKNINSLVKHKQSYTLKNAQQSKGILIKRNRMDCGYFSKEIIDVVEKQQPFLYTSTTLRRVILSN
ncbi:MAG: hypothetical protein V5787_01055 [Flavicella sp.]